ncbi:MAG: VanZ family protein [Lachnospiraceae bacterium]|nr:VanZ family protein [Lachnospiraceae bacterium]
MGRNNQPDRGVLLRRERRRKKKLRKAGLCLFIVYMAALVYFLFFADWYNHVPGMHGSLRYNLVPFREIGRFLTKQEQLGARTVFLNLGGNILGFVPFGFFLPVISRRYRSLLTVTGLGFLVSLTVEVTQLLTRSGCFDTDDILLNTAGAALGYVLFLLCDAARRRSYG